ncbi:hypothetical protein RT761_02361 [Atribacter laminatus]|uniref:Uncharacterized protein n=1 Tax=Atribacter laminatus TaxID=2847778 RepID=A0A7T1ANF7_ATRLM|nr:hypothetical protein RT761_02361 [Atribacter laminatus]
MQDTKLLGACGLYCGAGYHYLVFYRETNTFWKSTAY